MTFPAPVRRLRVVSAAGALLLVLASCGSDSAAPANTLPIATDPISTDPATTEPRTTDPSTDDPLPTEPITTEPRTTEPITTEPRTTDPITTEPRTTEPITTEPVVGSDATARLTAGFLRNPPENFGEPEARCVAEYAVAELSTDAVDTIIAAMDERDEVESEDRPLSDDDLLTLSTGFAKCADFDELLDGLIASGETGELIDCLRDDVGAERVETLLLFEILGDNVDRPGSPVIADAAGGPCAPAARVLIESDILSEFLSEDQDAIAACLPTIGDDELFEAVAVNDLFGLAEFVDARCS